jgi:hypothetical protein
LVVRFGIFVSQMTTCRKYFPILSSFISYHQLCNYINIIGDTLWSSCYSIFSFMFMFCRSLFVLLYLFFWSLCCLLFFDIRMLIAPLISSNSSLEWFIDFLPNLLEYRLFVHFQFVGFH